MRIINLTRWNTDNLTSLFRAGLKAKGCDPSQYMIAATPSETKREKKTHWVGSDGKALHGYAFYNRMLRVSMLGKKYWPKGKYFIRMFLPDGEFSLKKFAQIFEHEIDHTLGRHHREMVKSDLLNPTWHEGLTLSHQ
jgi:hypothetical protein